MKTQTAAQWREVEVAFTDPDAANPYTDVDAWVFTRDSGRQLRRPVFWDGGATYRVDSPRHNPRAVAVEHPHQPGRPGLRPLPARCSPAHPSTIILTKP